MPDPSSEALKQEALKRLDTAYAMSHATHRVGFIANRPEPQMKSELLQQRKAILQLASQLISKELEIALDELTAIWQQYRGS